MHLRHIGFCAFDFWSNFYQTLGANSSFSKVFESKRPFPLKVKYYKEHLKLGPIYVLKCALSENWSWKSHFYEVNFAPFEVTGSNPKLSLSFLGPFYIFCSFKPLKQLHRPKTICKEPKKSNIPTFVFEFPRGWGTVWYGTINSSIVRIYQ